MPHYTMPDGEKLFVREIGQGEPVLVLSGLGMHSWQWLPFLLPNIKHYKFYIPDWRGSSARSCHPSRHDDNARPDRCAAPRSPATRRSCRRR